LCLIYFYAKFDRVDEIRAVPSWYSLLMPIHLAY
jgi:hypothetical protein